MSKVGLVKEISGSAFIKDENGKLLELAVGDSVVAGDTVITNSINDKVIIALGDKEITLIGSDALKLDQSVLLNESFGAESSIEVASVQTAIFEGQNLTSLEETAAGGGSVGGDDASSLSSSDFTASGHESNVFEGYGDLSNANSNLYEFNGALGSKNTPNSVSTEVASISETINLDTINIQNQTPAVTPLNTPESVVPSLNPSIPNVTPSAPIASENINSTPDSEGQSSSNETPIKPSESTNNTPSSVDEPTTPPTTPSAPIVAPEASLSVKVRSLVAGDIEYGNNAVDVAGSKGGVFGLNGSYWLHNISENGFDDLITYKVAGKSGKTQMDFQTNDDLKTALDMIATKPADALFRGTKISYGDQDSEKNTGTNITLETNSRAKDGNLARFLGIDKDGKNGNEDGKSIEYTQDGRFGENGSSYAAGAFGLIELKGYVYMEKGKSYDFKFISDDGVRLEVGGEKVEFNEVRYANSGEIPKNASALLSHGVEETVTNIFSYHGSKSYEGESGLVPINIKYYDINGRSDLRLYGKESSKADGEFAILGTKESGMYLFNTDNVSVNADGSIVQDDTTSVIYGEAKGINDGETVEISINGGAEVKTAIVKNGAYEFKFDGKVSDVTVKHATTEASTEPSDIVEKKASNVEAQILDSKVDDVKVEVAKANLDDKGYDINDLIALSSGKSTNANELMNPIEEPLTGLRAKYYVTDKDYYAIAQANDYVKENPDSHNATFDAYIVSNFTRLGVSGSIASEESLLKDAQTQGTFLRPWAQIESTMPSGNVKFTDNDNADSGKSAIVKYDGYVYLEGGKDYKFKTTISGAQEIKIDGQDIFHKVTTSGTGEESYSLVVSRDRIIVESKDDGTIEAGTLRYGEYSERRGTETKQIHDGTSTPVNVKESGFYKFEATYLSSSRASNSRFTVESVDENGNKALLGDTARGGLLLTKDYYEKGEDGKFYKANSEYETKVSGLAEHASDGDQVEIYHNGELLGKAEVANGEYSFEHSFKDKPSADEAKFEVKYTTEVKKFDLNVLNIDDNELDMKALVAPIDGEDSYTIASVSGDTTLDLSKVGNLDEAMNSIEKIELKDNAKLQNVSKQDLLDISDKDKGTVLKIEGEPTTSVTLNNELQKDESAPVDDKAGGYEKFDATTEKGTISIKIDTDIQTDFS